MASQELVSKVTAAASATELCDVLASVGPMPEMFYSQTVETKKAIVPKLVAFIPEGVQLLDAEEVQAGISKGRAPNEGYTKVGFALCAATICMMGICAPDQQEYVDENCEDVGKAVQSFVNQDLTNDQSASFKAFNTLLTSVQISNTISKTRVARSLVPPFCKILAKKDLKKEMRTQIGGLVLPVAYSQPKIVAQSMEDIVAAIQVGAKEMLSTINNIYQYNPEPVHQLIPKLVRIIEDGGFDAIPPLQAITPIAKAKPELFLPYVEQLKTGLDNPTLFSLTMMVLEPVAAHDVKPFLSMVNELKSLQTTHPNFVFFIVNFYGLIGRHSQEKAKEVLPLMVDLLKSSNTTVHGTVLLKMRDIAGIYKDEVSVYLDNIKAVLTGPVPEAKPMAENLIDMLEGRNLKDLDKKVTETQVATDENKVAIVKVQTEVTSQGETLVAVEKKVDETSSQVKAVEVKADAAKQTAEAAAADVATVQTDVAEQAARMDELEKDFGKLKTFVEDQSMEIKKYIAEVSKKLPIPYKFSLESAAMGVAKVIVLHFKCRKCTDPKCAFPGGTEQGVGGDFVTKVYELNKWIKVAVGAIKTGMAIYSAQYGKAALEGLQMIKSMMIDYKQNYSQYISQPFLTSKEQDELITSLRSAGFFDKFVYSPEKGDWSCGVCEKQEVSSPGPDPDIPVKSTYSAWFRSRHVGGMISGVLPYKARFYTLNMETGMLSYTTKEEEKEEDDGKAKKPSKGKDKNGKAEKEPKSVDMSKCINVNERNTSDSYKPAKKTSSSKENLGSQTMEADYAKLIILAFPNKTWYLIAESEKAQKTWMVLLQQAMRISKPESKDEKGGDPDSKA